MASGVFRGFHSVSKEFQGIHSVSKEFERHFRGLWVHLLGIMEFSRVLQDLSRASQGFHSVPRELSMRFRTFRAFQT